MIKAGISFCAVIFFVYYLNISCQRNDNGNNEASDTEKTEFSSKQSTKDSKTVGLKIDTLKDTVIVKLFGIDSSLVHLLKYNKDDLSIYLNEGQYYYSLYEYIDDDSLIIKVNSVNIPNSVKFYDLYCASGEDKKIRLAREYVTKSEFEIPFEQNDTLKNLIDSIRLCVFYVDTINNSDIIPKREKTIAGCDVWIKY